MKQVSTARTKITPTFGIYFTYLTNWEIDDIIKACYKELRIREVEMSGKATRQEPTND